MKRMVFDSGRIGARAGLAVNFLIVLVLIVVAVWR